MPLLITLPAATPATTSHGLSLTSFYAVVDIVVYARRGINAKSIKFEAGYYASELASLDAQAIAVVGLPSQFGQAASPEEANKLPIFDFLDSLLHQRLALLLPAGTTIERVA